MASHDSLWSEQNIYAYLHTCTFQILPWLSGWESKKEQHEECSIDYETNQLLQQDAIWNLRNNQQKSIVCKPPKFWTQITSNFTTKGTWVVTTLKSTINLGTEVTLAVKNETAHRRMTDGTQTIMVLTLAILCQYQLPKKETQIAQLYLPFA